MYLLNEDNRNQLISKSKSSVKGKQRYDRRNKSKVSSTSKEFNSIDMNKLFKKDILTVDIPVQGETDKYNVKISFGGFLDILKGYLKNKDTYEYRDISRACITGFNKDDVYIHCTCPDFCLHEDTEIKLLNGEVHTIKDICSKFNNGEELWAYSVDANGDFKPGKITDVWVSGMTDTLVKVTLDNGREIITTDNHRYMLRDGSFIEAKTLKENMPLMSLYFSNHNRHESAYKLDDRYNHKVQKVELIKLDHEVPVYDLTVDKYNNFYVDAGVILHNCYRYNYYSTKNNTNSGQPETRPSKITNPNDTLGSGCKHILLVLSNTSWILRVARVINNYIHYMEDKYPKMYADLIYPAIFGRKYEDSVQLTFDDKDELDTSKDTIDVANDYNKKRTQFQKGNTKGVRFAKDVNKKDDAQINLEEIPNEDDL